MNSIGLIIPRYRVTGSVFSGIAFALKYTSFNGNRFIGSEKPNPDGIRDILGSVLGGWSFWLPGASSGYRGIIPYDDVIVTQQLPSGAILDPTQFNVGIDSPKYIVADKASVDTIAVKAQQTVNSPYLIVGVGEPSLAATYRTAFTMNKYYFPNRILRGEP
jgi:hypothetical protein